MKQFIINLLNIFYNKEDFNKKKETYFKSFKKEYNERTLAEKLLVECLYNLEFLNSNNQRFSGAAEAILIMENYIKLGYVFDYKRYEENIKIFGIKLYTNKIQETYNEFMIRTIKDYLNKNEVL
jgi:hypothetical protein